MKTGFLATLGLIIVALMATTKSYAGDAAPIVSGGLALPGGNVGGGTGDGDQDDMTDPDAAIADTSYYTQYYGHVRGVIGRALRMGLTQYVRDRAHPEIARATLRQGIQQALYVYAHWSRNYQPLTVDALKRALELDLVFNDKCGGEGPDICQPDRRAMRFLYGYLQHVYQDILPLDNDYCKISSLRSHSIS